QAARQALFEHLQARPLPLTLLSQYLPNQAAAIRQGLIANTPADIVIHKIMEVTQTYARACHTAAVISKETI
ncbi:MAG TPA: tagatose-bisphosphate aldolase, partial [Plesiomonas shigelloides]|nr:tagatose-bisphosphate aldolase [Plesiomonas shigelloides]